MQKSPVIFDDLPHGGAATKCLNEHRVDIQIEVGKTEGVLPEIFDILNQAGATPTDIDYDSGVKQARARLFLYQSPVVPVSGILCRIEALEGVEGAEYFDGSEHPPAS